MFQRSADAERPSAAIDLTPMMGILAALLAIFATCVPRTEALSLNSPGMYGDRFGTHPRTIDVSINADGRTFFDGISIAPGELDAKLAAVRAANPPYFALHVQRSVRYQQFARTLAALQRSGAYGFSFEVK